MGLSYLDHTSINFTSSLGLDIPYFKEETKAEIIVASKDSQFDSRKEFNFEGEDSYLIN